MKDQPVEIQFRGISLRSSDRAFFVKHGESCEGNVEATELAATAEYTFAEFAFAEAERYELCYMYSAAMTSSADAYMKVAGLEVLVNTVLGVTSVNKGNVDAFVANYTKELTFSLVQHRVLDNSFFAVPADAECSEAAAVDMTVEAQNAEAHGV